MIVFPCTNCGKELQVREDLAGQTSACSACGQTLPVPLYPVASPVPASVDPKEGLPRFNAPSGPPANTPLPAPLRAGIDREAPTMAPSPSPPAPAESPARLVDRSALAPGISPELYDFLLPPQEPGELGRLGAYRVLRVLGSGGMGVVFQAEDTNLKRMVALKAMLPALAISPSALQRFLREAVTAAQIDHDHIVHIYHVGEDRGVPFLA